jgi:hypothetical protein
MIEELPANTKVSIIVDDRTHLLDAIAIGMGYSSETIIQEDSVLASKAEILWEQINI